MKTKCYFDKSGQLVHIGEWDFFFGISRADYPKHAAQLAEDIRLKGGKNLSAEEAMVEFMKGATNPLPSDLTCEEREVVKTNHGTFLADDYAALRRKEYPPMRDQLDALWKGGKDADDMRARVMAVKSKFPKP